MVDNDFINSLYEFNLRVLYNGDVNYKEEYTIDILRDKLFFNKVFYNNMNEMFEKYDMSEFVDLYVDGLMKYVKNIDHIIFKVFNSNIRLSDEGCIESRLEINRLIEHHISTRYFGNRIPEIYRFVPNNIYYISMYKDDTYSISYIDMHLSIYSKVLHCLFNDCIMYWKVDECICDYLNQRYEAIATVPVRITMNENDEIVKVEYTRHVKGFNITSLFRPCPLIIINPYIYIDDILRIVDEYNPKPISSYQIYDTIDFDTIFEHDVLIEYPKYSFDIYLGLLALASKSDNVKSISITLYRIGDNPTIYYILRDAIDHGIKVNVNIELYARGESINKLWLTEMSNIGIDVSTYGGEDIKVHTKLTQIVFTNGKSIVQVGTGNYHTQTTSQYTDLSLVTSDGSICNQVKKVFDILRSKKKMIEFSPDLLVTRYNARDELLNLIDEESRKGINGYIIIKCNSFDDDEFIEHLDLAVTNGCKIIMIIRGVCTWNPDPLGIYSNVIIKSIIWDKLEHSRIYCFGKINPKIYLGSLDLVTSKIDNRIETLVSIKDPDIKIDICKYLNKYITNTKDSWIKTPDGIYVKEK